MIILNDYYFSVFFLQRFQTDFQNCCFACFAQGFHWNLLFEHECWSASPLWRSGQNCHFDWRLDLVGWWQLGFDTLPTQPHVHMYELSVERGQFDQNAKNIKFVANISAGKRQVAASGRSQCILFRGVYGARATTRVMARVLEKQLSRPPLVRETSRWSWRPQLSLLPKRSASSLFESIVLDTWNNLKHEADSEHKALLAKIKNFFLACDDPCETSTVFHKVFFGNALG